LLDAIRSKRIAVALGAGMVAAGALIIEVWPSFPLVLAAGCSRDYRCFLAGDYCISLGLVGNAALASDSDVISACLGGGALATGFMGFIAYLCRIARYSSRLLALVLPRSSLSAASSPQISISAAPRHSGSPRPSPPREPGSEAFGRPLAAHIRRLRVLISDG